MRLLRSKNICEFQPSTVSVHFFPYKCIPFAYNRTEMRSVQNVIGVNSM